MLSGSVDSSRGYGFYIANSNFTNFKDGNKYTRSTTNGQLSLFYNPDSKALSVYVDGVNKGGIKLV